MVKLVFPIRVSGKERRERARKTLLDCLHFENMLIILIREFYDKYRKSLTNISIPCFHRGKFKRPIFKKACPRESGGLSP